ncbi:MAG: glycoside hydrolase family 16 protein, partial [Bacteroidota bacterium]
MKTFNQIKLAVLIFSCSAVFGCKQVEEVAGCQFPENLDNYELVWSDEFDGTAIDESKWSYDLGDGCDISEDLCGWGNNELEYYTDRSENSFIRDGKLVIEAKKEFPFYQGQHEYTSARMVTKNKGDWTYGRIDVRAKMPLGQGLWPAIWMLPTDNTYGIWPKSGEIDIMEYLGHEPERVFGTIHYGHDFWRFNSQGLELEEGTFAE